MSQGPTSSYGFSNKDLTPSSSYSSTSRAGSQSISRDTPMSTQSEYGPTQSRVRNSVGEAELEFAFKRIVKTTFERDQALEERDQALEQVQAIEAELQDRKQTSSPNVKKLAEMLTEARRTNERLKCEIEELVERVAGEEKVNEDVIEENRAIKAENDDLSRRMANYSQHNRKLQEKAAAVEKEKSRLEKKMELLCREMQSQLATISHLNGELGLSGQRNNDEHDGSEAVASGSGQLKRKRD